MISQIECEVVTYSIQEFKRLLTGEAADFVVDNKVQCQYLDSYLTDSDIDAKTIVVEKPYIDRDYLADYAGYYVRCFAPYPRWCARLHFFAEEFERADLMSLLAGEHSKISKESLADNYIGFTVAKPLPETIFGRTCLKTFSTKATGRDFPCVRDYKVNLFGIELKIKTIAFQEQDTVAAACATSAIWCAFQGTGVLFQHQIPSPLTITRSAIKESPSLHRPFPAAAGLTDLQIAQAVRSVGLDPLDIPLQKNWLTKAVLYAYLRGGIPVLLNGIAPPISLAAGLQAAEMSNYGHTITIVGYRVDDTNAADPGPRGLLLRASKTTRVYAHDDGVGPFTRLEFEASTIPLTTDPNQPPEQLDWLSARWGNSGAGRLYIPDNVIVPIITTIRIPFLVILEAVLNFDAVLELLRTAQVITYSERLEWDIYLTSANAFKTDVLSDPTLAPDAKQLALMTALPRFLWRVTARLAGVKTIDFLFDSTDIEQGAMLVSVVIYDDNALVQMLIASQVLKSLPFYELERISPQGKLWEYFLKLSDALTAYTSNQSQTSPP